MRIKRSEQIGFSSILFDTLFGLVLYFSIDSILDIKGFTNLFFYLFSIIIVVHCWLLFKSCDDAYEDEVTDSGLDILIGIIELVLIEFIVLSSRVSDYISATIYLIILLCSSLVWAYVWLRIGKWRTTDQAKINQMEKELKNTIKMDLIAISAFIIYAFLFPFLSPLCFVIGFVLLYIGYIILSFKYNIIDIDIF
jgi:hypothetical protein